MRSFTSFVLLAGLGLTRAQNVTINSTDPLAGLLQTFVNLGCNTLASVAQSIGNTSTGQNLFGQLTSGNKFTIFAPNDHAFVGVPSNISGNQELLADVLSYHVVLGDAPLNETGVFPNTTVARTSLNSTSDHVFLEGGKSQVLAWSNQNGTVRILNQNTVVSVLNSTSTGNLTVNVVDAVIDLPGDLFALINANNLTSFKTALNSAQEPNSSFSLLDQLEYTHGFTAFAPNDAAFNTALASLGSNSTNTSLITTVLMNHVLNGTSVYSPTFATNNATNYTTAAGDSIQTFTNSTGTYVQGGNSTARIVVPDLILWNGVVHVIDTVLLDATTNTDAASSAFSSATSAAAVSSTAVGPIGSPTSTSASGSSASGNTSGAGRLAADLKAMIAASGFGLVGVLIGAAGLL